MDEAALHGWWDRSGLAAPPDARVDATGSDPVLDCRHRIGEAAASALGLGAAWAAELWPRRGGRSQSVAVDVTAAAASLVGFALQRAPAADLSRRPPPFTKLYRTGDDRWIHLHGGFPHLASGLVDLLGCEATDDSVAAAGVAVPRRGGRSGLTARVALVIHVAAAPHATRRPFGQQGGQRRSVGRRPRRTRMSRRYSPIGDRAGDRRPRRPDLPGRRVAEYRRRT